MRVKHLLILLMLIAAIMAVLALPVVSSGLEDLKANRAEQESQLWYERVN